MSDTKQIDDGGPAFPRPGFTTGLNHGPFVDAGFANCHQQGMSLRDWFAGRMLAQIFATQVAAGKTCTWAEMAEIAYASADAMLAARKEKQ